MTKPVFRWASLQSLSVPGSDINEDAVASSASSLIVVDGATSLSVERMTGWPSDARWFANSLTASLAQRLDGEVALASVVRTCLQELAEEYGEEDEGGLGPSASLLIARLRGPDLEIYSLGDCLALIGDRNGVVQAIRDDSVGKLDTIAVNRLQDLRGDLWLNEARSLVQNLLVSHRRRRNTTEGYWVADLSARGVDHALIHIIPAEDVRDVALMTDGFAAALDIAELIDTPSSFLQELRDNGPRPVMNALKDRLDDDAECTVYPRLKPRDDSSVVFADVRMT